MPAHISPIPSRVTPEMKLTNDSSSEALLHHLDGGILEAQGSPLNVDLPDSLPVVYLGCMYNGLLIIQNPRPIYGAYLPLS